MSALEEEEVLCETTEHLRIRIKKFIDHCREIALLQPLKKQLGKRE